MRIEHLNENGVDIAVISGDKVLVSDVQSALDLVMSVKYETGAERVAIPKELICEEFFILSTGIAGEILQKFINYHMKVAIYGDYSRYTSKPLRDFIYESNQGRDIFFPATRQEAIRALAGTR